MSKIRARFKRGKEMKYLAHLDLMRVFERGLRRADLPIEYSGGFNPHPKIVFGLPLGVGIESKAEFVEIKFKENINIDFFIEEFNRMVPEGLEILSAEVVDDKKNVMALVTRAKYEVECVEENFTKNDIEECVKTLLNKKEYFIEKKSKSTVKKIDVIKLINNISLSFTGKRIFINMDLHAGSKGNLKPELVVKSIEEIMNTKIKIINIIRTELYLD